MIFERATVKSYVKAKEPTVPIVDIFCLMDDFCKHFHAYESSTQIGTKRKKTREPQLTLSEIMTILVLFHRSGFKTFKEYYQECILGYCRSYFPKAVSYHQFVELMPRAFMPLVVLSQALKGKETGKYFVDSAKLSVCHNLRIYRHKVFKGLATRGKTSTGWFPKAVSYHRFVELMPRAFMSLLVLSQALSLLHS